MQYRRLGKSNLNVSALCLGSMMFGDQTALPEAGDIVASAQEHGINFIDTADVYTYGESERIVGRLLAGRRHDWVLASKLGNAMDRQADLPGVPMGKAIQAAQGGYVLYSRQWILRETDAILARLQTDYLDILYLHRDHLGVDLEEAVRALGDLIRAGKIRAFGLSNFRGWRIAEVVRLCKELSVPQPVVCQPYYNLLNRGPEVEILPACAHYGIGVVPYSPIARGVLTGKYQPGATPPQTSRAGRGDRRILQTEFREESLQIAHTLQQHAESRGWKPGHLATAWVLANPIVSAVIVGPRTLAQLEDYYPALDIRLGAAEEALIDALVAPGHASTPGYTDPAYPFFGRPVGTA